MLKGKNILLGVTGSIAAYKAASLASMLVKAGADVDVIMTRNACELISPMTFSTLTKHSVSVDTFARVDRYDVTHISLAQKADIAVIAPATANIIAKMACGIADDMLSTVLLACHAPTLVAPAMNTGMLDAPATIENMEKLRSRGVDFIDAAEGLLACGDVGRGRMAEPEDIFNRIDSILTEKDMSGLKVLVSAGPTKEALDPVRFISNHSTGKMGFAIAREAAKRGADVTLVSGPVSLSTPAGVRRIDVVSAADMAREIKSAAPGFDMIIMTAAVADFTPQTVSGSKIKKNGEGITLQLKNTEDILSYICNTRKPGQVIAGFAMETDDLLANARNKLIRKGADIIAANRIGDEGAGFGCDTNRLTLVTAEKDIELPLLSKDDAADRLLDLMLSIRNR